MSHLSEWLDVLELVHVLHEVRFRLLFHSVCLDALDLLDTLDLFDVLDLLDVLVSGVAPCLFA